MLFMGEGGSDGVPLLPKYGGGKMFRAYDKATESDLGNGAARRHYRCADDGAMNGKQYLVVAIAGQDVPGELVAFALP